MTDFPVRFLLVAAFLTVQRLANPIESAKDLVEQSGEVKRWMYPYNYNNFMYASQKLRTELWILDQPRHFLE